ncbi:piggyBac transposable element-derived protein 1-like [Hydra vulgaris]|uniref:PiggyBac transposable element-derived protein 1-like n=1 Tax=Hydra vulgaris TaxID=6087 RepID=A0ABM4B9R8_HYDVU
MDRTLLDRTLLDRTLLDRILLDRTLLDQFEISSFKNCITVNRFEKIRQFIHSNDNTKYLPQGNLSHGLHKIRLLIDHLNLESSMVPLDGYLSVDEQLCSTKVSHFLKQYIPMKPFKWGFKLFVICGVSGFAYKFEVYSGQENKKAEIDQPDVGASANVVKRLSTIIPANQIYRLYFDNYYTSLTLFAYLAKKGILSLGTVRHNRIPDCKFPTEKIIKKDARGTSHEFVGEVNGIEISSLVWKNNKAVVCCPHMQASYH